MLRIIREALIDQEIMLNCYIKANFDGFLIWYQSLDDQAITSSNLTIIIYLIKIKQNILWTCASFKPKGLSLKGVLENNINNILEIHVTV